MSSVGCKAGEINVCDSLTKCKVQRVFVSSTGITFNFPNVTRSGKTGLIHTFCISRNTYLKYSMRFPSLVVQYNHARCIILIV